MAEELQHLMDKIQTEAIDKGEKDAEEIVSKAKQKAAAIIKEAEKEARNKLEQADQDAKAYAERGEKTLEQSARDLLITVGQGVENILSDLVAEAVDEAMTIEVVEKMLVTMVDAYVEQAGECGVEFLISPKDRKKLVAFFSERYREKMAKGIELHTDNEIVKGFRISLVEDSVYHDFTKEAIAESLSNFLRADLSRIVNRVARENGKQAEKKPSSEKEDAKGKK